MKLFCSLTVLLLLAVMISPAGAADGQSFRERPGVNEFSGRMIVRPHQAADLAVKGLTASRIVAIREGASMRLDDLRIRYESDVDEHIVAVPAGFDENSFAALLMATGDYEYVEPDWICYPIDTTPNDPSYNQQWHHPKIESPKAWDISTGSLNRTAAFVDTGVDKGHEDLSAHLVPGYNSQDRLTEAQGGQVSDVNGHGTAVCGCIGAIGNNSKGVAGVNWTVSLMPIRTTNSSSGSAYLTDLTHGARWAAQNGAQTVSVSYSGVEGSTVQTAGADVKSNGGLLIWAAGNSGQNLSWFDHADVIIAGATTQSDSRASFSNYGQAIDVMAPGVDVYTTRRYGGYTSVDGTSFSAPLTNGLCALIWGTTPSSSPDDVEQFLFSGCDDIGSSSNYGHGRINVYESILLAQGGIVTPDIKINGEDAPAPIPSSQLSALTISLDPGNETGVAYDWWISADFNFGATTYWFQRPSNWTVSSTALRAYNGALMTLNDFVIFQSQIPAGWWEFTFTVDALNNTYEGTYSDTVSVQVY